VAHEGPFSGLSLAGGLARAVVRPGHARLLCEGHFPGEPLLPGAYLVGLMADLAAHAMEAEGAPRELEEVERCLFLHPVTPEHEIVVTARRSDDARIEAEVHTLGRCAARAQLRFGASR
jgi:3-hydroxymyristoyl/3-hydroxydecanoyl-(acyl carrier protein) dehydratase